MRGYTSLSGTLMELSVLAEKLPQKSRKNQVWQSMLNWATNLSSANRPGLCVAARAFLPLSAFDRLDTWRTRLASNSPGIFTFFQDTMEHFALIYMQSEWAKALAGLDENDENAGCIQNNSYNIRAQIAYDWPLSIQVFHLPFLLYLKF